MENGISIKGTREGLTVTLAGGDLAALIENLSERLETQGAFFRGGLVALQLGNREVGKEELSELGDLFSRHEMVLRTVLTSNPASRRVASAMGLRLVAADEAKPLVSVPQARAPASPLSSRGNSKGVLIHRRIRSGQIIRHTGHIVVVGDVNAGAEIIAGGDIVVWGRLSGTAHAGAMGDLSAVICALDFSPLQLRIGELITRPAEEDRVEDSYPEIAQVRDETIVVEPWDRAARGE